VPEKSFAAFLDMIGIGQAPAVRARVPVTFYLTEGLQENVFISERTQVATSGTTDREPPNYETCKGFTASKASIEAIFSLDPTGDKIFSHIEDLKAGREFKPLKGKEEDNLQRHALYLGHDNLFRVKGQAEITLIIDLNKPISQNDWEDLSWSYWGETGFIALAEKPVCWYDGKFGFVKLKSGTEIKESSINGIKSFWICCELKSQSRTWTSIAICSIKIKNVRSEGIKLDLGFYNFLPLDLSHDFYPFGRHPGQFDAFYMASKEAFSKKGADIEIKFEGSSSIVPVISWQYWNGTCWASLDEKDDKFQFNSSVKFACPDDLSESEFCGEDNYWIRALLISGNYQEENTINNIKTIIEGKKSNDEKTQEIFKTANSWALRPVFNPPIVKSITIMYSIKESYPDYCLTYNNMEYNDFSEECKGKNHFDPFLMLPHRQPAILLGFNRPFDKGNMSIFFSLKDGLIPGSEVEWCYLRKPTVENGSEKRLDGIDNTNNLAKSDALEFLGPGDQERAVKFGRDCYWLVGCLKQGREFPTICGIYPNTVWAEQVDSFEDEILGSSEGEKSVMYSFIRRPVIAPEIWVRE